MAVSLYYLGDPLMHPSSTRSAGSPAPRAAQLPHQHATSASTSRTTGSSGLLTSGLTHLTVCVDGLRQESYERTRVGGRIDLVLDNLERTLRIRRELRAPHPKVEVQFIRFQHNRTSWPTRALVRERGCRPVHRLLGQPPQLRRRGARALPGDSAEARTRLPQCTWPHFAMQVQYDGDVIPCCYFRHGDQYRPGGRPPRRRQRAGDECLGRLELAELPVAAPARVRPEPHAALEPALPGTFCDGCPTSSRPTSCRTAR